MPSGWAAAGRPPPPPAQRGQPGRPARPGRTTPRSRTGRTRPGWVPGMPTGGGGRAPAGKAPRPPWPFFRGHRGEGGRPAPSRVAARHAGPLAAPCRRPLAAAHAGLPATQPPGGTPVIVWRPARGRELNRRKLAANDSRKQANYESHPAAERLNRVARRTIAMSTLRFNESRIAFECNKRHVRETTSRFKRNSNSGCFE